jgi:CheY-like chemotaxis protein
VLDFSKLEAGEVTIRRRPANPERAAREVLEMFTLEAATKGLDLRFEADESLPPGLILDEDRLRQILINLVGNAVKFTERGRVSLALSYDRAGRLVADVADTGPGIAPEAGAKLFQRFSQIDGSSTRSKGGAGLGLAICRGLAEAMGGSVALRSAVGEGSTFRLELPAPATARPGPRDGAAAYDDLEGLRVLVADDNPANRELVRAILEPYGVEVSEAHDGREAVDFAADLPVDLILMDLRMPRLAGGDAAAEIRAGDGPNRDIPILSFSAEHETSSARSEPGRVFSGRIRKPLEAGDLLNALRQALLIEGAPEEESRHHAIA